MRVSALRLADSGAAVQLMNDITTDRLRIVADNIEIFAKVDAFNHIVNHQRFNHKPNKGKKPRLDIKYKAGGHGNHKVC